MRLRRNRRALKRADVSNLPRSVIQRRLHLFAELVERLQLTGFRFWLHRCDRLLELFDLFFLTSAQVSHHGLESIEEMHELIALTELTGDLQAPFAHVVD